MQRSLSVGRTETALVFLVSVYVAGLVLANAMGSKVVGVGGSAFTIGAFAYPLTFVTQDVVSELYGKAVARKLVYASVLAMVILVAFSWMTAAMPDAVSPQMTDAHALVFGSTPRIVLASLTAFILGGLLDVSIFFWVKRRWPSSLTLRKLLSTVVSQFVDSALFVVIAFGGRCTVRQMWVMVLGQYVLKQVFAIAGLPLTHAAIRGIRA